MDKAAGFHAAFLVDGKPPEVGARIKQSALAATLEHLAGAGLDDFYRGDVGREIAADLERIGSPVTRADLEKFHAFVAEPLSVRIQTGTLYNAPPPTQGLASLIILALFERLRVAQAESFEHVHGIVEATKRAFRVRDRVITDPDKITADLSQFLSPAFLDADAGKIDPKRAAKWPQRPARATPSGWAPRTRPASSFPTSSRFIGSSAPAACCRATGMLMQNRGASFSLDARRSTRWRRAGCRSTPSTRRWPN